MENERSAYYRLAELFGTLVPAALSDFLQKTMSAKLGPGYKHTSSWWKANKASLSRAPPAGFEIVLVDTKDPSSWPMNLLLKVIKYSNHDLLQRYGKVWEALNKLIEVRENVFDHKDLRRVPLDRMETYFTTVFDSGLSFFDLANMEDIYDKLDEIKTKSPSEEEGEKFHKELLKQEKSWNEFEERLYERGAKPKMVQLKQFFGKTKKLNIIQDVAPHYTNIGTYLLKDNDGTIVDGVRLSKMGDVVRVTEEIFSQWLQGGAVSATWDTLIKCLRHAGRNPLAKQIDECLI